MNKQQRTLTARILSVVTSGLMVLHPSVAYGAGRTSDFTPASSPETFRNPAATNHFGQAVGRGGGCSTCGGGGAVSTPNACPGCPGGGGLAATDCPTCGRGANLKVAGCTQCGEPEGLLVHNGEFFYTKTDLVIPGVGLDFRMCRIYRSSITYDGPIGKKWEHCHNVRVKELANGDAKWLGMGREDTFVKSGSTYTNPTGWFGTLSKLTSPTRFRFVEPQGLTWNFEDDSGSGDGWYRLQEKKDRNSNALAYAYDGNRRLVTITDTLNRNVTLSYDGNGRLTKVKDFGNREVIYGYNEDGTLKSARTPTVDAEGSDDDYANGKTTTYSYDGNGRLDGIENPANEGATAYMLNTYDGNGKLTSQRLGVSGQNYSVIYNPQERKTTVTDRESNKSVYWYDSSTANRVTRVDLYDSGYGALKTYLYEYAAHDLITKVTLPRGNIVESLFDSNGNLTSHKLKTSSGDSGLATTYTYTPDYNLISTVTNPLNRTTDYDYGANGNITTITYPTVTSPSGIATTNKNGYASYDGVISWAYAHTSNGQVSSVIDPRGTTTTYTYSAFGSLSGYRTKETIDPATLNLTRQWAYDQFGNVTSTTDGENNTTTYVINDLNQVLKVTSPLGYVTKYHYDKNDNLTKVEIENDTDVGNSWFVTDHQYDLLNNITKTFQDVDASNRITTAYEYDKSERLTKIVKPALNEVTMVYDLRDLLITRTRKATSQSDDSSEIFEYDNNANLTKTKDGRGNATTTVFDLYDRQTTITDPLSHYAVFAYDNNSNLTKASLKNSAGTLLAESTSNFDEVDRLWKAEELARKEDGTTNLGDGQRTTILWRDEMGGVLELTDESGTIPDPDEPRTFSVYDKAGRLVTTKDALSGTNQNKVTFQYDKRSLLITRISHEKSQDTAVEPDRTIQAVYEYDSAGRLTKETNQNGDYRTTTLNKRNLPTEVVDENGKRRIWRYDELRRVVTKVRELVANGTNFTDDVTTEFFYDANSRLVTMRAWNGTTGNQDTVHEYDKLDRVTKTTHPDTFNHQYTYDKADNPITTIDPNGSTIVSTFDASNRGTQVDVTRATGVEGVTKEAFAYDGLNRLTNAYNEINSGTIEFKTEVKFAYNTLSLVEKETLVINGYNSNNGRDTSYTYDAEGRLLTLTYPDSPTVTYTYDANDRIDVISRGTTTVCDYAFAGPLRTIKKDKPGTLSTYKYDALGRVTEIKHKRDSNNYRLFEAIYGYDKTINPEYADLYYYDNADGRITSSSDDQGQQYYYDNAYRLTKAYRDVPSTQITTRPPTAYNGKYEYLYDVTGNRTTKRLNDAVDTTYSYDKTNALTSMTGETLAYDSNGNATDHRAGRFSWYDYQNRRVRINNNGSDPTTKSWYDALGRRVQKEQVDTGNNWVKRYYFAGWLGLDEVSWSNPTETITHRWVYGPWIDEPLEFTDIAANPDKHYYYEEDRLGSIRAIADDKGVVEESYRYSEWGNTATYDSTFAAVSDPDVSPIGNRFAFTGRQLEEDLAEAGVFLRARHYDAGLGRFLQRDPASVARPRFNQYLYVSNAPGSWVDPLGLEQQCPLSDPAIENISYASCTGGYRWVEPRGRTPGQCDSNGKTVQPCQYEVSAFSTCEEDDEITMAGTGTRDLRAGGLGVFDRLWKGFRERVQGTYFFGVELNLMVYDIPVDCRGERNVIVTFKGDTKFPVGIKPRVPSRGIPLPVQPGVGIDNTTTGVSIVTLRCGTCGSGGGRSQGAIPAPLSPPTPGEPPPGPSTPAPSTPGPGTPGPSTPGPSTPGPRTGRGCPVSGW